MKVLLVNKFYYPRGGDCIYTLALEKLLCKKGHEVAVFSMNHDNNLRHRDNKYWVSTLEYSKNIKNIKETILRPIYSNEVACKYKKILKEFKPDVVHLNNIHTQLSPLVAEIANKEGIRVVWTLHDYKIICPAYTCTRNEQPCELCINKKLNVIKYRCIKNSLLGSILGYTESVKWNLERLQSITDQFICPSNFLKDIMLRAGGETNKFTVLPNFIKSEQIERSPGQKENYICYFGRLTPEKGVETLLKAVKKITEVKLKIAGSGPLEEKLKNEYLGISNIEFLGFKHWIELKETIRSARFSVIPSEWYENNPLSIIESMALGTPVLGARIGGIPEMIKENANGFLFESGNKDDLESKIRHFYSIPNSDDFGRNSIDWAKQNYSDDSYYKKLRQIYLNK